MYLDPGFGSMIIQIIIAGIAVLGTIWFSMKNKIKAFFKKKKGGEAAASETVTAAAETATTKENDREG